MPINMWSGPHKHLIEEDWR